MDMSNAHLELRTLVDDASVAEFQRLDAAGRKRLRDPLCSFCFDHDKHDDSLQWTEKYRKLDTSDKARLVLLYKKDPSKCRQLLKDMPSGNHRFSELVRVSSLHDKNHDAMVPLARRPDIRAFISAASIMTAAGYSLSTKFYLLGFLHLFYWSESVCLVAGGLVTAFHDLGATDVLALPEQTRRGVMTSVLGAISPLLDQLQVYSGEFLALRSDHRRFKGAEHDHAAMNPMGRRTASMQWEDLLDDAGFPSACEAVAAYCAGKTLVSYNALMAMFWDNDCKLYSGEVRVKRGGKRWGDIREYSYAHYNTVHFLRGALCGLNIRGEMTMADWNMWQAMGGGVVKGAVKFHIQSHEDAVEACKALEEALAVRIGFEDLTCLMCMGHNL